MVINKDFTLTPIPISELVAAQDFPRCALGKLVNIGGFTGVVMEIVKQSLKVTSQEGDTVSYNANGLRKIYAPKLEVTTPVNFHPVSAPAESIQEKPQTPPNEQEVQAAAVAPAVEPEPAPTPVIHTLNFDRPAKPIIEFASRPDFPKCTLGELLNIGGYAGVVVEIVKQSLKVQSVEGRTMSFNAIGLRKLYGTEVTPSVQHFDAMPVRSISIEERLEEIEAAPEPKAEVKLDYTQPVKVIRAFAGRRDFPECALGQFVDVRGFSGIVAQIVGESLELRAEDGTTRSYDIEGLRKIFGR